MPLCDSNCMVFAIFLIVHTLCNFTPPRASVYIETLQECYTVTGRHIKICMKKFNDEKIFTYPIGIGVCMGMGICVALFPCIIF